MRRTRYVRDPKDKRLTIGEVFSEWLFAFSLFRPKRQRSRWDEQTREAFQILRNTGSELAILAAAHSIDPAPITEFIFNPSSKNEAAARRLADRLSAVELFEDLNCENGEQKDAINNPQLPMMPCEWFHTEFGIPATRLRQAKKRRQISVTTVNGRNHYSVADARRLWPHDMVDGRDRA